MEFQGYIKTTLFIVGFIWVIAGPLSLLDSFVDSKQIYKESMEIWKAPATSRRIIFMKVLNAVALIFFIPVCFPITGFVAGILLIAIEKLFF